MYPDENSSSCCTLYIIHHFILFLSSLQLCILCGFLNLYVELTFLCLQLVLQHSKTVINGSDGVFQGSASVIVHVLLSCCTKEQGNTGMILPVSDLILNTHFCTYARRSHIDNMSMIYL